MNNKGQSIIAEYSMIVFIVIAALVAMTSFVQRTFQGRIHDARNYLINSVNTACDSNCQAASGGVRYEYEPYYMQTYSLVQQSDNETTTATIGSAKGIGAIYAKYMNQVTQSTVPNSCQLPPICADNKPRCECNCPSTC